MASRTSNEFLLRESDFGRIHVETDLVRRIVERAAVTVDGINEATATVEKTAADSPLKIRFNLTLGQDYSVNDVSSDLVKAVRKILQESLEIIEVEIYVRVTDIKRKAEKNKRRVR